MRQALILFRANIIFAFVRIEADTLTDGLIERVTKKKGGGGGRGRDRGNSNLQNINKMCITEVAKYAQSSKYLTE